MEQLPSQNNPEKKQWTWRHGFKGSSESSGKQKWDWRYGYNKPPDGAEERKWDSRYGYAGPKTEEQKRAWNWFTGYGEQKKLPEAQRERHIARGILQISGGILGLSLYGLTKVGDVIKWLLKQSKETADIAKGWEEGMAFVGAPGAHKS